MAKPIIKSINALKGLAVFHDYRMDPALPVFRKHNLVYGFNGCGKTTLSRVLRCLGSGSPHQHWPTSCAFEVEMTDGAKLNLDTVDEVTARRILVFNEDFVSENFRWSEGEANPIFYLSKEQKED